MFDEKMLHTKCCVNKILDEKFWRKNFGLKNV